MASIYLSHEASGVETVQLFSGGGVLTGVQLSDHGTAVSATIYDGTADTDPLIIKVRTTESPAMLPNVRFSDGLFVSFGGASTLSVYIG